MRDTGWAFKQLPVQEGCQVGQGAGQEPPPDPILGARCSDSAGTRVKGRSTGFGDLPLAVTTVQSVALTSIKRTTAVF